MENNKSKKSNREGTGKKHPCLYCKKDIPLYKKYCNRECYNLSSRVIIKCIKCGVEKTLPKNREEEKYCSLQCANQDIDRKKSRLKAVETLKEKYNINNPFEVIGYNNLNIKRNGVKTSQTYKNKPLEEKQAIKEKISQAFKNKSLEEKQAIKEKIEQTNLIKYGVKSALCKESPFREIADLNNRGNQILKYQKWLEEHNLILLDEFNGVKDNNGDIIYYNFKHAPSGTTFTDHLACGRLPMYKDPNWSIGTSNTEKELIEFIKNNYEGEVITNTRKLVKGFEIDIFLPGVNIAIEFDGLYWHSELNGKGWKYHLYKTEKCEEQGIQLIHIFEDEWRYKENIVKSRILNILGKTKIKIYARQCTIKEIDNKTKNKFLIQNHIQGEDKSKYKFGLYHQDELVSLITLGNLRKVTGNKHKENNYELLRFCNKLDTIIIGGFSKLLKHFIKTHHPESIISYADRRWSMGELYKKNNFIFVHNTNPNYWYMKYYNQREHRFKYTKQKLSKILPNFSPELSEWENMKNNKYDKIWDCGSKKYEMAC